MQLRAARPARGWRPLRWWPVTTERTPSTAAAERAEWIARFVAAVTRRANQPGTFTVFEAATEAQLPDPPRHTLWGAATGIAHREGLIVSVAAVPSLRPRTAKSLVRLWVGARYAEGDEVA